MVILSHVAFISKSNSENCIKIRLFLTNSHADKNKLAPFYGPWRRYHAGIADFEMLLNMIFTCVFFTASV